jgi:ABC-type nitrate/sulfonate/bicarbonate transport system substrate-binding protein
MVFSESSPLFFLPSFFQYLSHRSRLVWGLLLISIFVTVSGCEPKKNDVEQKPEVRQVIPIRIGWQVSWATQGQLAQTLKHTNILELNHLKGEFKGFSYGGPLNEAALAGEVDVIFTADQPAASLMARNAPWTIIARLVAFRATIIVPPESPIKQVEELKGKTIAIPFGASTHRIALRMMKEAGLDPAKEVKVLNLDILEQTNVVQRAGKQAWGDIDALASWDPFIAIFESKGLARPIQVDTGISVVVMANDFIAAHPEAPVKFLKAYQQGYLYYATHQRQADQWFADEARLKYDLSLLGVAASFETNMKAKTLGDIDVKLTEAHIQEMQRGAKFAFDQGLTKTTPDMQASVNLTYLEKANAELSQTEFSVSEVRVTSGVGGARFKIAFTNVQ